MSRRRDRVEWSGAPVAEIFAHATEENLIRLRDFAARARRAIAAKKLTLHSAFEACQARAGGSGGGDASYLSRSDLAHGVCVVFPASPPLTEGEVAELFRHADQKGDGFLNYREFAREFADPLLDGEAEAQRAVSARQVKAWRRPAVAARVAPIVQPMTSTVRKTDDDDEAPAHLRIKDLTSIGDIFLVAGSKLQVRHSFHPAPHGG